MCESSHGMTEKLGCTVALPTTEWNYYPDILKLAKYILEWNLLSCLSWITAVNWPSKVIEQAGLELAMKILKWWIGFYFLGSTINNKETGKKYVADHHLVEQPWKRFVDTMMCVQRSE